MFTPLSHQTFDALGAAAAYAPPEGAKLRLSQYQLVGGGLLGSQVR